MANRKVIADLIAEKLSPELAACWSSSHPIRHFYVDNLFPDLSLADKFPHPSLLLYRNSLRERKRAGVQIDRYHPDIAEYLYAFQEPIVVESIARITGLDVEPDPLLYASGISMMLRGDFLNPHIDNSHDWSGTRYRALNLLFYVSPDWKLHYGGNLELWDDGVLSAATILSRFNRLVVMETHQQSWHSVSKVQVSQPRLCLSNYYFTTGRTYRHATTFAGRPEQPFRRLALSVDGVSRNLIAKAAPSLLRKTTHVRKT
jgi:Rps23 Pro-64 3,4-dihydroxylase Tpa1-like proline 4-hydroxylase